MKKITCRIPIAFACLVLAQRVQAAPEKTVAIRADSIRANITYLASDALAGRGSGTRGNEMAARYIASTFQKAGLKPIGTSRQTDTSAAMNGTGYFQPFTFTAGVAKGKGSKLEARIGDEIIVYKPNVNFTPSDISAAGAASGDLVFVGYGIQASNPARDDYNGLDVKNKVVMALTGTPGNDPHSPLLEFSSVRAKAMVARDKGATGLIMVLPKGVEVSAGVTDESAADVGIPVITVRQDAAAGLIKGQKPKEDVNKILSSGEPSFATSIKISLNADVHKVTRTTANIVGLLEGSDPVLKNEVVVIGAHMDHLGMGGTGSLADDHHPAIHHGADDNASGTAGVMALSEYFSASSTRPRRSLLFICFSGEELGLLGSAYYVKHPIIPLDRTAAMLNMDMIGRMDGNKLIVSGSGTSSSWNGLLDDLNKPQKFQLFRNDNGFGASDQQSFYVAKIPVLFFFTGLHTDYHKPSDTADKINSVDEARVVEFVAACAERIADSSSRPDYLQMAASQDSGQARFRVSLGSIPDYAANVEGVQLSGVRAGSPAEKAGLKQGDIIVKFGDRSIRNVQDYTVALGEHSPGDVVTIVVKRGTETVTLTATLAGSRR